MVNTLKLPEIKMGDLLLPWDMTQTVLEALQAYGESSSRKFHDGNNSSEERFRAERALHDLGYMQDLFGGNFVEQIHRIIAAKEGRL